MKITSKLRIKSKLKIIISILALLISQVSLVFATSTQQVSLYHKKDCETFLKYNGRNIKTSYIECNINNKEYPAYCLNLELPGVGEVGDYNVTMENKIEDINLWRVLINGYPYKSFEELGVADEEEAFTATKQAVYITLYNRDVEDYSPVETECGIRTYEALKLILNNAQKSKETIFKSENLKFESNTEEWIFNEEEKFLFKEYKLKGYLGTGKFKISIDNNSINNIKILNANNEEKDEFSLNEIVRVAVPIKELTKDKEIHLKANIKLNTYPVFIGKPDSSNLQNYAITGIKTEEFSCKIKDVCIENLTSLKIIKKEEGTEKTLKGVKFDILNENLEVIYNDLETNEKGEIVIKNLLPGIYYVYEKEGLTGYIKYNENIKVEIPFNCEYTLNINNKKEEEQPKPEIPTIEKEVEPEKLPITGM